jgi:hypothetical protein
MTYRILHFANPPLADTAAERALASRTWNVSATPPRSQPGAARFVHSGLRPTKQVGALEHIRMFTHILHARNSWRIPVH